MKKAFCKVIKAIWGFIKPYFNFTKLLCFGVLAMDYKIIMSILDICYIAVNTGHDYNLPALSALAALSQATLATVLAFAINKAKVENSSPNGGIQYLRAQAEIESKEKEDDCSVIENIEFNEPVNIIVENDDNEDEAEVFVEEITIPTCAVTDRSTRRDC